MKSVCHKCFAYYHSGIACQNVGQYEEAISHHKEVVAKYPQFARAWNAQFMIAVCYDKMYKNKQISATEAKSKIVEACQTLKQEYPNSKAEPAAEVLLKDYNTL